MADQIDVASDQLTQGQIDCLLLVRQQLTSKEIAARLGISSHTVDQRIRVALRILGCKGRVEAARLVASGRGHLPMFQFPAEGIDATVVCQPRPSIPQGKRPIPLPFATKHYPKNEMSIPVRLLWIGVIAFGAALSAGMYLAGLESLARLIQT